MPRTVEQLEEIREESRAKILHAALRLFARFGFERTSIRAISRDAGVSLGLLYNYFDGKDDLLRAIFERSMRDVQASFADADNADDPALRLEQLIRRSFDILSERLEFWRLFYSLRMQPAVVAGLTRELEDWIHAIRHTLTEHLRATGADDPEILAELLFATIDGVAEHYALDPEHYPLDQVVERFVSLYIGPTPEQERNCDRE